MAEHDEGPTIDTLLSQLGATETAPAPAEERAPEMGAEVAGSEKAAEPPAELEAPPTHHSQEQARDEHGRFTPGEGEEPQEQPPAEPEPGYEVVTLMGDDGEEIELEVPDPDLAARINNLVARAREADGVADDLARARMLEEQAQSRQAELDEIQEYLNLDPAGFLTNSVRPDLRQQVVMELIAADDAVYEAVSDLMDRWQLEPHERRLRASELKAERVQRDAEFQRQVTTRRQTQQRASELVQALRSFVPPEMEPTTARRFYEDMYRDLRDYGSRNGWTGVSPETLPDVLAFRLNQYGIEGTPTSNGASRPEAGARVARPANAKAAALTAKVDAAKTEGERLRLQYQRRRAAGASAPSGVGTPTNRARPPKGASLDQALDWANKTLGV